MLRLASEKWISPLLTGGVNETNPMFEATCAMADAKQPADEVPAGAAVFPVIPEELGVHPLLLAALHAIVFLDGSAEDVVNPAAADEAVQYLMSYFQRLRGAELKRVREDIETLLSYARQEKWPAEETEFLRGFLTDYGVGEAPE